jgi:hypothetical protein
VEVSAGAGAAVLLAAGERRPLPAGSALDPETGLFTWQPGPGVVGAYDFVFVLHDGTERALRIVLSPGDAR